MQALITYGIVALALVYAVWLFLPQAGRRWVLGLLIASGPLSWRARLERLRTMPGTAGCDTCKGCEEATTASSTIKTITVHRR